MVPASPHRLCATLKLVVMLVFTATGNGAASEEDGMRCLTPQVIADLHGGRKPDLATKGAAWEWPYTYVSPSGRFELHYETAGPDSVPSEDVDPANGIPDYVERCAEYADFSWTALVDSLGFTAPELPSDGTYDISFMNWPIGVYGVALLSGTTTEIVIHSNFAGPAWGLNDDPDGPALGRAKVTLAHELRHASQFTNNGWTEGLWTELDATWVEDIVYPLTNDYLGFIDNLSNSQLDAPWVRLDDDDGDEGSYEDCLWQHYLSGEYGEDLLVQLWADRAMNPEEDMHDSYTDALKSVNTDWPESYASYLEWCWFTGTRWVDGFGFPDAQAMWRMELRESAVNTYPFLATDVVDRLAGHPRRFNKGSAVGNPRILFDADDSVSGLTLSVIVRRPDTSFTIVRPALDSGNACDYVVPEIFPDLSYVAVIVTSGDPAQAPAGYTLEVKDEMVTGVPALLGAGAPHLALEPPRPNPSSGAVRFAWTQPTAGAPDVRIVDVGGRVVRRLPSAEVAAGRHEGTWDGRDESGRLLANGVYWVRVEHGRRVTARPVTLLR